MSVHRIASSALFLLALIAVFILWSQVGGQGHLDLVPWYLKLALGTGAAFAFARAAAAAAAQDSAWNGRTLRWAGIVLALLIGCGLATYYAHLYYEEDDTSDDEEPNVSSLALEARIVKAYAAKPSPRVILPEASR